MKEKPTNFINEFWFFRLFLQSWNAQQKLNDKHDEKSQWIEIDAIFFSVIAMFLQIYQFSVYLLTPETWDKTFIVCNFFLLVYDLNFNQFRLSFRANIQITTIITKIHWNTHNQRKWDWSNQNWIFLKQIKRCVCVDTRIKKNIHTQIKSMHCWKKKKHCVSIFVILCVFFSSQINFFDQKMGYQSTDRSHLRFNWSSSP